MKRLIKVLKLTLLAVALSGCMESTGGGVYRDNTDPVTGSRTIQTAGISFLSVNQGMFSGLDTGVSLGGKVIDGVPYLILGYSGESWLFMRRAKFRFDGSETVYTLAMNSPARDVGSTARAYENQTIRADRGQAEQFLNEIIKRSRLSEDSKIYVRAEGQDVFVSGVGTFKSGPNSFGAFFQEYVQ